MMSAPDRVVERRRKVRGRDGRRPCIAGALLLLLIACAAVPWAMTAAMAQTEGKDLTDYRSGQVTAVHGSRIVIDGREYELDADVTVVDDDGKSRTLKDLEAGSPVRFHLKRGRIDVLVLILPK
jgi:cytochrome oxidase Cu insertion factor (SCO1/SenC/PrrC family)